jgi:acetyl esterase/lipase
MIAMPGRPVVLSALAALLALPTAWAGPAPTHTDVRYSKQYERSVLDFWKAESDRPAPLIVYFHGGGFRMGSKEAFRRSSLLADYYPKGVAFASVNYPFLEHTRNSYSAILRHTEQAIRFLASKAKEWNIDPRRIAVSGSSAGALISEYLACGPALGIRAVYATMQPIGTDLLVLRHIGRGDPPIIVYNPSGPNDKIHPASSAKQVLNRCRKVGVYCEIWGTKANGLPTLPDGTSIDARAMKLIYRAWRLPLPEGEE